jgi:hypothetical protein
MNSRRWALQLPPLWLRWALACLVAVAVIASVVILADRAGPEGPSSEAGAEAETNRIADLAITEDEAPHSAGLAAGAAPASALERAIAGDVRARIAAGELTGPLQSVRCAATGSGVAGRDPYRCTVHSDGVAYPFLGVADVSGGRLTWCKVDPPAVAGTGSEIPISAGCRG